MFSVFGSTAYDDDNDGNICSRFYSLNERETRFFIDEWFFSSEMKKWGISPSSTFHNNYSINNFITVLTFWIIFSHKHYGSILLGRATFSKIITSVVQNFPRNQQILIK